MKYEYDLTTISSLILSPRNHMEFYAKTDVYSEGFVKEEIRIDKLELKKENVIKIIYPFYQYGNYEAYAPDNALYYIPGSSLKGAICQRNGARGYSGLLFDDIALGEEQRKYMFIRNLCKLQYLNPETDKKVKLEAFFPNIGVEMLAAGIKCSGECYYDEDIQELLKYANEKTRQKIGQMTQQLEEIITNKLSSYDECKNILTDVLEKMKHYQEKNNIFLLGGYKGLYHSTIVKGGKENIKSGIYIDIDSQLPHGIVEIDIRNI